MNWLYVSSCLCLLLLALSHADAAGNETNSCDPNKENLGCSPFGRCDKTLQLCFCNPGFTGDGITCQSYCTTDKQSCSADKLSCVDMPTAPMPFACLCPPGYQWSEGAMKCIDTDECSQRKCSPYSQCTNTVGSYECKCCYDYQSWEGLDGYGYLGDGKTACYPDSILHYNDTEFPKRLFKKGYTHTVVPGGFPLFGQLYWDIYVHLDGLITFNTPDAPYLGGDTSPTHPEVKFVAPFWTSLEVTKDDPSSGLYVDEYSLYNRWGRKTTGNSAIDKFLHGKLRGYIDDINLPGFEPTQILMATWVNMTVTQSANNPFQPDSRARITFQAVLTMNGTHSFGFMSFAEDPKNTDWNLPLDNVYVGFSGENFATRQPVTEIGQLFQDPPNLDQICTKMSFITQRGRIYKVFGPPFVDTTNPECLFEASKQYNEHQSFGYESEDDDPDSAIPKDMFCPCFEEQAHADDRFVARDFERPTADRHSCHLSRFYKDIKSNGKSYKIRSYCCYDQFGALVTKGPGAGGVVPDGYELQMVALKQACCSSADLCDIFHDIYTPVTCRGYERPRVAYIRGAGHFNNLGNVDYTFNGRGEFRYFRYFNPGDIEIQIRMEDKTYPDGKTSFVTAMVTKCEFNVDNDEVVRISEVRVRDGKLELIIDGNLTPNNTVLPEEFKTQFFVSCTEHWCETACKWQRQIVVTKAEIISGGYLQTKLMMPSVEDNPTRGLIGSLTGELLFSDDSDHVITDVDDGPEMMAFGESWRLTEDQSKFTYTDGDSWATYNTGTFTPTFWGDLKSTINIGTMDEICHCNGDHGCQYDQLVTDNVPLSTLTYLFKKEVITVQRAAFATMTAQWDASNILVLSIHEDYSGDLSQFTMYDEFGTKDVIGSGKGFADAGLSDTADSKNYITVDYYNVSTTLPKSLYDHDGSTGEFNIFTTKNPRSWRYNSYSVTIYAQKKGPDGMLSQSRYSPDVFVCACAEKSQCDFSFAVDRTALGRATSEDNYYILPCHCPADTANIFCENQINTCAQQPCDKNAHCMEDSSETAGYKCTCMEGYSGNGHVCTLNECPANSGCEQVCSLDPFTAKPICSCRSGYILQSDGTCKDRNECNYPQACPDAKAICVNFDGGYNCECELGFKPMKGIQRWGCLSATHTYSGSLLFDQYWDFTNKTWKSWHPNLAKTDTPLFRSAARQLEVMLENFIKVVEPSVATADLFTYVYKFTQKSAYIQLDYKVYPPSRIDDALVQTALRSYVTLRSGEAAGLKGILSSSVTFSYIQFNNFCSASCASPFATCHNTDSGKNCRCNPGFVESQGNSCESYCFWKQCSPSSTESCRDLAQVGPECLCKKGYALNAQNECEKVSACPTDSDPCGRNAECIDQGDGSYTCKCAEGFIHAAQPSPDLCVPDVLFCRGDNEHEYPDSVDFKEYKGYYKVAIPVGFPYFDTKQWKLFVGPNGIISMGKNITASELASYHPADFGYLIAPLWTDFIWNTSRTKIQIFDETTSKLTPKWSLVKAQILNATRGAQASYSAFTVAGFRTLNFTENFDPTSIIIVTWTDLRLKPFPERDTATMQTVIASDGQATVVIWNYDTSTTSITSWQDPKTTTDPKLAYPHRGWVGFMGGNRRFCFNRVTIAENQENCRDFLPSQLTEYKGRLALPPGRHVFLVANTDGVQTLGDRQCFNTMKEYEDHPDEEEMKWIESELSKTLPDPCPWTETQVKIDLRFNRLIGPRGKSCYVKRFLSPFEYPKEDGIGKVNIKPYCCYRDNALLMDVHSNTHLIIDEYSEFQSKFLGNCCQRSAHCFIANFYVPYVYVDGYEPPITAGVFGDPHLVTFYGANVTFKGRGDFVLFKSPKLNAHGRFKALDGTNGSALNAVAWHYDKYQKVAIYVADNGKMSLSLDDKDTDLEPYTGRFVTWKMDGHIQASASDFEQTNVDSITIVYNDGLTFEVIRKTTTAGAFYLHLRIRLPAPLFRSHDHHGLLSDFIYPNGEPYQPKYYGTLFIGDEKYFHNYGRNWTVSSSQVPSLFPTSFAEDDYVPPFYEGFFNDIPANTPIFERCREIMPCAYDYTVTGDESVANSTLVEVYTVSQRRQFASEKPPEFSRRNPSLWVINLKMPSAEFKPSLVDPSDDITFFLDTNFPKELYKFDKNSGHMYVIMNAEVRDTFLNKGPFYFYLIATRGETGSSAYSPLAVRICNCNDERSCDYSDDIDSINVGVIPTENADRYTIARCNCFSFQTGKFCDVAWSGCTNKPCYPNVPCFPLQLSNMLVPSFSCGSCPRNTKGDGFHCVNSDPCDGVSCTDGKVCQNINGYAVCGCPGTTTQKPDGTCNWQNRCDQQPKVCTGDGQRCNNGDQGTYYCGCKNGYMPRYQQDTTGLELTSCQQIAFTFVGSLTFAKYYNQSTKSLEVFKPAYRQPETEAYQVFARRVVFDLNNAATLLKSNLLGVSVREVRQTPDLGFAVDFLAYSNARINVTSIKNAMALYYYQINKVGVIVHIEDPLNNSTFVDICNSRYSPCRDIAAISTCTQRGIFGEGAICTCSSALGYETQKLPSGDYRCNDVCDSQCKAADPKSKCKLPRTNPTAMYECICQDGSLKNEATGKCEALPPVCTASTCPPNSRCVPYNQTAAVCLCNEGFQENSTTGRCESYCERVGSCKDVTNAYGCQNNKNDYQCLCRAGYQWNGVSKQCQDLNECIATPDICQKSASCINTVGSYRCQCGSDYDAGDAAHEICYVKTSSMLYPYSFTSPAVFVRSADAVLEFPIRAGFAYGGSTTGDTVFDPELPLNLVHKVYVGFDGFVGLNSAPPFKYFGLSLDSDLIAPFWTDLDFLASDPKSGLYVDAFDAHDNISAPVKAKWQEVFRMAQEQLQTQYPHIDNPNLSEKDTVPMVMLVLTWYKVTPAPATEYGKFHTTFQAVLGANPGFSFAIFNYLENPAENQWPSMLQAPDLQPRIGYTIGVDEKRFVPLPANNEPPNFDSVFDPRPASRQLRGRIVHAFGDPIRIQTRQCLLNFESFSKDIEGTLYGINAEGGGLARHGACPGFLKQIESDARWQPEENIGKTLCYGGSFWHRVIDTATNKTYSARSFCCYDMQSGAYLSDQNEHIRSYFQVKELRSKQEELFDPCCVFSNYCELFNIKMPNSALDPKNYDMPVNAYVRGDPHIGMPFHRDEEKNRQITFNGLGEYTLIKSNGVEDDFGAIEAQIRFSLVSDITKIATFVTGIAIKTGKDVIEVINFRGDINLLKNGETVDLNQIIFGPGHDVQEDTGYDIWAQPNFIGYVTASGLAFHIQEVDDLYFNIRISMPRTLSNHLISNRTCGLLTSFESEPFLDCDGNKATGDIWKNEQDAYNFGQHFKVKSQAASLFSYKVGPKFDMVNSVPEGWKPMFTSQITSYPPDVDKICDKDNGCRFDYAVTLNSRIGAATKKFGDDLQLIQSYSGILPPEITGEGMYIYLTLAHLGIPFEYDASSPDEGTDGFYYELITNLDASFYSFNATSGQFSITANPVSLNAIRHMVDAPYLRFVAHKGQATDILIPTTWTCACDKPAQCDTDYAARPIYERQKNIGHNYFMPCKCPPTARGKFCESSFDPCEDKPCTTAATCKRDETSATGFTCGACPPNFASVNGICKPKVCPENTCTNGDCQVSLTDGSFVCLCKSGYEVSPSDKYTCRDINECQLGTHNCYQYGAGMQCTNTPGSFVCGCRSGYAPDSTSNFKTCLPVSHQLAAKAKVDFIIVNNKEYGWSENLADQKSEEYHLVSNALASSLAAWYAELGRKIQSIVIHKLSKGSIVADYAVNSEEEIDVETLVQDQKDYLKNVGPIPGSIGAYPDALAATDDGCLTDDKCDPKSTECQWDDVAKASRCECLIGFIPNPMSTSTCDDNCGAMCVAEAGAYSKCTRFDEKTGNYTCDCLPGYYKDGKVCKSRCDPNPCKNNAICSIYNNGANYVCQCNGNWVGTNCDVACNCGANGVCLDKNDANKCTCNEGYTGPKCDACIAGYESKAGKCISKCATNPCQNGGVCALSGNDAKCICPDAFAGELCDAPSAVAVAEQNLTIVAAVLGTVCGLLLFAVLGFACLLKKTKKASKKKHGNDFELKQRRSSSSSSNSSDSEVPQIEIRAPTKQQTAFSPANNGYVAAPQPAPVTAPQPVTVAQTSDYAAASSTASHSVYAAPIETQVAPQPVLTTSLAPPASLPAYDEIEDSADF